MAYSNEAALAWLASESPLTMSSLGIARVWGWHRNRVGSFLKGQEMAGVIERDGKTITVHRSPVVPKPQRKASVYFIGTKSYVKIGSAIDVNKRRNDLQTAHPVPLEILATIPNVDRELEFDLHKRFDSDRLNGEWFNLSLDLRAFIITARLPPQ